MRILTFGLTSAFQRIMLFDSFQVDNVNRAAEVVCCASGKSVNTAIGIETLDRKSESILMTPLAGPMLPAMESELEQIGVKFHNLPTSSPTRTCTTLIDRNARTVTELVENGLPIKESDLDTISRLFYAEAKKSEMIILTGSLPAECPKNYYHKILEPLCDNTSGKLTLPVLCDIRGEELLRILKLKPFLVKPNRYELGVTLNRELVNESDLINAMKEINRLGAKWVVITSGAEAVYVSGKKDDEVFKFKPIQINETALDTPCNPIGCGDSMSAALGWAICRGETIQNAVKIGIAAATQNFRQILPCRLDSVETLKLAESVEMI
ncbi:MAG: 1-phosphofructokinase family hexose kinase [Thermoguttaceae bacterium]